MRLIDADRLKGELLMNFAGEPLHGNRKITMAKIRQIIDNIPDVEVLSNYRFAKLKELAEADKEGRCVVFPAGFEFENGIYVLCGDISKVKEDKKGYSIKSKKAYFLIKNEEKYILVSVANMPENLLEYYETQIGMNNAKEEETK